MSKSNIKYQICISLFLILLIFFCSTKVLAVITPGENTQLTQQAEEAAKLLGIQDQIHRFLELKRSDKIHGNKEALELQLFIARKVMTAALVLRTTSAKIDRELVFEQQAYDKLSRDRDDIVAATNNANFLQLSILSIIIDGPLEQSRTKRNVLHGNELNIVSGALVGSLAAMTVLEEGGGIRKLKAQPNMLGQTLGLNPPNDEKLPPMLWTYLSSISPTYNGPNPMTRREQLLRYWKTERILQININKQSTIEKVSVLGPHHHWWSERMKLISSRITMLFDLRAMVDLLNAGLVELLHSLD